jgi:hypothetical protein
VREFWLVDPQLKQRQVYEFALKRRLPSELCDRKL